MDLKKETEIVLRDAGFETWPWENGPVPVVCFENDASLGFVHFFDGAVELQEGWQGAQDASLARFTLALRGAGEKAWNVYAIFLAKEPADDGSVASLDRIEENFSYTRKIVRAGIRSQEELTGALLPLLPIRNSPRIDASNFEARLDAALQKIHPKGGRALLGNAKPVDIAQILAE